MENKKEIAKLEKEIKGLEKEMEELDKMYDEDPSMDQEYGLFSEIIAEKIMDKTHEIMDLITGDKHERFEEWYYSLPRSKRPY